MRHVSVALLAVCLLAGTAWVAVAQSPHFIRAIATIDTTTGDLVVAWKEAGLGDNLLITYVASADGSAVWACINNGGNHPRAANKETVYGPVSSTGTFPSGKNGNITASLNVEPPGPGAFTCPNGQDLELVYVGYADISLEDTTNGIIAALPWSLSACLVSGRLAGEVCP